MLIVSVIASMVFTGGQQAGDGADLNEYLQGIRASGISEVGKGQLIMVAGICAGATIFQYQVDKASGRYWPSYTSATCPKPDADPPELEKWKLTKRSDTEILADKLKAFADSDQSGFVTTQEASDFRYLVEYGYLVAQVVRDEGATMELVTRASGKDAATASRELSRYRALTHRLAGVGVTCLPDATVSDAQP